MTDTLQTHIDCLSDVAFLEGRVQECRDNPTEFTNCCYISHILNIILEDNDHNVTGVQQITPVELFHLARTKPDEYVDGLDKLTDVLKDMKETLRDKMLAELD